MPEIREWEEQEFPWDRRALKVAASQGRIWGHRAQNSHRTIDRSPNPCERLLEYAKRYRRDGSARKALEPDGKVLRHLAHVCLGRSDLLDQSSRHAKALIAVSAHWRDWIRPLDAWESPDDDKRRQFGSLVRHLFAHYEVPRFLDAAWLAGLGSEGLRYQAWYKQIGRGESIRKLTDLPISLTRAMAHWFTQAPDDLGILPALRWGQVRGMGGNDRLAHTVLNSRIGIDFSNDLFWTTVIRWLIDHPDLASRHHGPIIDYLHNQKFEPTVANPLSRQRGQKRQALTTPAQPDLSMKGRTPTSLLRAIEDWHKRLGTERIGVSVEWKPSSIHPFSYGVGEGPTRKVFSITELISYEELRDEGEAMGHCVATYWMYCYYGQCSIWSLTTEDDSGETTRLLTLEIRPTERKIVQARGPGNREPTTEERAILAFWSESGGPSLGRSLLLDVP